MNFAAALFAPILSLFAAVGGSDGRTGSATGVGVPMNMTAQVPAPREETLMSDWSITAFGVFEPDVAHQVHIEQRMTIRISPRAANPAPPEMFSAMPQRSAGVQFTERKIGKCLPVSSIVGAEPYGPNNLVLFLRDRRMINAQLEHSCHSRAFYSGFYLSRSADGMVCIDRDTLLSRSGSACKLSRIRQMVEKTN